MGSSDVSVQNASTRHPSKFELLVWFLGGLLRGVVIYLCSFLPLRYPDEAMMSEVFGRRVAKESISLKLLGEDISGATGQMIRVSVKEPKKPIQHFIYKRSMLRGFKDCLMYGLIPTLIRSEAEIYRNQELLGLSGSIPRHHYSFYRAWAGANGVLMEDLSGCTGGRSAYLSVDQVISVVRVSVQYYNRTWRLNSEGRLPAGCYEATSTPVLRMFPEHWRAMKGDQLKGVHREAAADYVSDESVRRVGDLLADHPRAYRLVLEALFGSQYLGLVHGDARSSNVFFRGDGSAILVDWQTSFRAHPMRDLAWTILSDLRPADLRQGAVLRILHEFERCLDVPVPIDARADLPVALLSAWFFSVTWLNVGHTRPEQQDLIEVMRRRRLNIKWCFKEFKVHEWVTDRLLLDEQT